MNGLPTPDNLMHAKESATTPEACEYFFNELKAKVADSPAEFQSTVENIRRFFEETTKKRTRDSARLWFGIDPASDFVNFHENSAKDAIEQLRTRGLNGNIDMYFAVSKKAEFVRSYLSSVSNEEVDEKGSNELDTLFNSWLTEHGMMSKEGVIYESDDGNSYLDAKGNPIRADADTVSQMVHDKKKGFQQFIQYYNKNDARSITMTPLQQPYPEDVVEAVPSEAQVSAAQVSEVRVPEVQVPAEAQEPAEAQASAEGQVSAEAQASAEGVEGIDVEEGAEGERHDEGSSTRSGR